MKTDLYLDHSPSPSGRGRVVRALLRLTGEAPTDDARVPLNLALVLDRSGSMHGEPLAAAKEAAIQLVRRLAREDVVSVVAYDDRIETVAEPATGEEQRDLVARIRQIEARGMTNLSGGWLRGRDLAASRLREGGVNRVVLLTDGLANEGITEPEPLCGLCRTAASDHGISTTTIGFGPGYDEDLLRGMADAGRGGTYYIERTDQAVGVFGEEIEGLLTLCAQNVTVDVLPAAVAELAAVHHAFPRHDCAGGLRLELGDLYAREPKALLTEFFVPSENLSDDDVEVAMLLVRGHVLGADGSVETREIRLRLRASLAGAPTVEPEIQREALLLEAAAAREDALKRRGRGDFEGGAAALRECAAKLSALPEADAHPLLSEEAADLAAMAERFEAQKVDEADVKYMAQRSYSTHHSRHVAKEVISRVKGSEREPEAE